MELVIATTRPFKLDDVDEALIPSGVQRLIVAEVKGFGRQDGQTTIYRGAAYRVQFMPTAKVEVAIPADHASAGIEAIMRPAQAGRIGDCKISVRDLERAVRIRAGETDTAAL
jgi:nitrogen regulatory protein P-II 2